jgi:hypothetical protein
MKILIPKHAIEMINQAAINGQKVKHTKIDLTNAQFLLDTFYNGGQLLTRKQAIQIYNRLKYLHSLENVTEKTNKAVKLNGGTGFFSFLERTTK